MIQYAKLEDLRRTLCASRLFVFFRFVILFREMFYDFIWRISFSVPQTSKNAECYFFLVFFWVWIRTMALRRFRGDATKIPGGTLHRPAPNVFPHPLDSDEAKVILRKETPAVLREKYGAWLDDAVKKRVGLFYVRVADEPGGKVSMRFVPNTVLRFFFDDVEQGMFTAFVEGSAPPINPDTGFPWFDPRFVALALKKPTKGPAAYASAAATATATATKKKVVASSSSSSAAAAAAAASAAAATKKVDAKPKPKPKAKAKAGMKPRAKARAKTVPKKTEVSGGDTEMPDTPTRAPLAKPKPKAKAAAAPKKTMVKKKKKTAAPARRNRFVDDEAEEADGSDDDDVAGEDGLTTGFSQRDLDLGRHKNPEHRNLVGGRGDSDEEDDSFVADDDEPIEFMSSSSDDEVHRVELDEASEVDSDVDIQEDDRANARAADAAEFEAEMKSLDQGLESVKSAAAAATEYNQAARRPSAPAGPRKPSAKAKSEEVINAWKSDKIGKILEDPSAWNLSKAVVSTVMDNTRPLAQAYVKLDDAAKAQITKIDEASIKKMLGFMLTIARQVLTRDMAGATDMQMLRLMSLTSSDEASKQHTVELGTKMRDTMLRLCPDIRDNALHRSYMAAMRSPTCSSSPEVIPDGDTTYKCAFTEKDLGPGDKCYLVVMGSMNPRTAPHGILRVAASVLSGSLCATHRRRAQHFSLEDDFLPPPHGVATPQAGGFYCKRRHAHDALLARRRGGYQRQRCGHFVVLCRRAHLLRLRRLIFPSHPIPLLILRSALNKKRVVVVRLP